MFLHIIFLFKNFLILLYCKFMFIYLSSFFFFFLHLFLRSLSLFLSLSHSFFTALLSDSLQFSPSSFRTLVALIIIASSGLLLFRETMSTRNLQKGELGLPRFGGSRGKHRGFFVGRNAAFLSNIVGC